MEKIIVRECNDIHDTVNVLIDVWKYIGQITLDKCVGKWRVKFVIEKIED